MGAFSGLITLAIAFWFHSTTVKQNQSKAENEKQNAWVSFWVGAATYFGCQWSGYWLIRIITIFFPIDIGIGGSFGEASGGDTGALGVFYEILPILIGIAGAYWVQSKWLSKIVAYVESRFA